MGIWLQGGAKKPTGGRYHYSEPKKKMHIGRVPTLTRIGKNKVRTVKALGNGVKLRALELNAINVYDAKKKKTVKASIEDVVFNPANRHYVRMDVLTKGAVLKTDLGYVKVTNRPSQEGLINGVFTEFKEESVAEGKSKKSSEKVVKKHENKKEEKKQ